jgi:hypothetical protein
VVARLLSSRVFKESRSVGAYVSCERLREVDTRPLLHELFCQARQKACFVPLVGPGRAEMRFVRIGTHSGIFAAQPWLMWMELLGGYQDLEHGTMGILEPSIAACQSQGRLRQA